nr:hypothetical protein [Allomuricauda sp.]
MKTLIQIHKKGAPQSEMTIARNLSRIMDMRILDIDTKTGKILISYASPATLKKVYRELERIGCRLKGSDVSSNPMFIPFRPSNSRPMCS